MASQLIWGDLGWGDGIPPVGTMPFTIQETGWVAHETSHRSLFLDGSVLWSPSGYQWLRTYDISNIAANPTLPLIGSYTRPTDYTGLESYWMAKIDNTYFVAARRTSGYASNVLMSVVLAFDADYPDLSVPKGVFEIVPDQQNGVGPLITTMVPMRLNERDYLLCAGNAQTDTGGFVIIEVTDPANMAIVGYIPSDKAAADPADRLFVHGVEYIGNGYCALAAYSSPYKIWIVDCNDPSNPVAVGKTSPNTPSNEVRLVWGTKKLSEKYLVSTSTDTATNIQAGTDARGIIVTDISDLTNPKVLSLTKIPSDKVDTLTSTGRDAPPTEIMQIFHRGERTYVAASNGNRGAAIFELTDPLNPIYIGNIDTSAHPSASCRSMVITEDQEHLILADGPSHDGTVPRGYHIAKINWRF